MFSPLEINQPENMGRKGPAMPARRTILAAL